jgi:hypothetical protein
MDRRMVQAGPKESVAMKRLIALVIALGFAVSATAQVPVDNSGNKMLSDCGTAAKVLDTSVTYRASPDDMQNDLLATGSCLGYIQGFRDTEAIHEQALANATFCIPSEVENGQLVLVILKYLKANPESLHQNRAFLTFMALGTAYPCAKLTK